MKKNEIEARLRQVRKEKDQIKEKIRNFENDRDEHQNSPERLARSQQYEREVNEKIHGRNFLFRFFDIGDPVDRKNERKIEGDILKDFGLAFQEFALDGDREKLKELEIEEGKLLDKLSEFEETPEPSRAEQKDEVIREMKELENEKDKLMSMFGDDEEERRRIENMIDRKRSRLLEKLGNL